MSYDPHPLDEYGQPLECLDDIGEDTCRGPVEYHTIDGTSSWPRCRLHFAARLERYEQSDTERYARSSIAPSWFDPADAGERWEDDY